MSRATSRLLPWLPLAASAVLGITGLWLEAVAPRDSNPSDALMVPLLTAYAVAGGLICSRERGNAAGWLLSALSIAMVSSFAVGRYAIAGYDGVLDVPFPQIGAALSWTWIVALSCPVLLAFVVPTGRPLSRSWARVMSVVAGILAVVVAIFALGNPGGGSGRDAADFANPIFVPALEPAYNFVEAAFVIYVALFATGAAALGARFRSSHGAERQQLKWILFGMVAMLIGLTVSNLVPTGPLSDGAWALGMLALPVALAIAIRRHRLYDIDLVIKRTVSYGVLSVFLVAIEVSGILLLQELLAGVTSSQSYAVAATTLGVAALFQPARRRIQAWVDRRFDRDRYDLAQVADGFGSRLRDRMDLGDVQSELITAAAGTLRPSQAWVWLRGSREGSPS